MVRKRRHVSWLISIAVLLILFVAVPLIAKPVIRNRLNAFFSNFSPVYKLHVDQVGLSLVRGGLRLEGITGEIKTTHLRFLEARLLDVSVAWRDLLDGRLTADVDAEELNLILTRELIDVSKTDPEARKQEAKKVADLIPLRVERVSAHDSNLEFAEVANLPKELRWDLANVEAQISNLTATHRQPFAVISARGTMMDSALVKIAGKVDRLADPPDWKFDMEMRQFDLVKANKMLLRLVPLDFAAGTMDLYIEALSKHGFIRGYAKPFLHNLVVIKNNEHFKNAKHVLTEYAAAILNLVLRTPIKKIVAAKIPFRRTPSGPVIVDQSTVVTTVLQNGFGGGIEPGIEDKLRLEFPHHAASAYQKRRN